MDHRFDHLDPIETLTFANTNTNATYTDSLPERVNGQRAFYRVMWVP